MKTVQSTGIMVQHNDLHTPEKAEGPNYFGVYDFSIANH